MLKKASFKNKIRLEKIRIKGGESLWLGGIFRIDLLSSIQLDLILYIPDTFSIFKMSAEKSHEFYIKNFLNKITPVYDAELQNNTFRRAQIVEKIERFNMQDFEIDLHGFGFIGISSPKQFKNMVMKLDVYLHEKGKISVRKALVDRVPAMKLNKKKQPKMFRIMDTPRSF
jgi:hypothetical protein